MSNVSFTSRPLGTAMVGGAIAMAILDILVRKNVLTVDDAQGVLKTAQSSSSMLPRSMAPSTAPGSSGRSRTFLLDESAASGANGADKAELAEDLPGFHFWIYSQDIHALIEPQTPRFVSTSPAPPFDG